MITFLLFLGFVCVCVCVFAGFARGQCKVSTWSPQFAAKWLSVCIGNPFEPTRTIWTQKLFPLFVSSWKLHLLECIEPVQKEIPLLWRVTKQAFWVLSRLDCLGLRACVTYLLAPLCDDVIKTSNWRKKERGINISTGQKQTGSRQAEPDEGM